MGKLSAGDLTERVTVATSAAPASDGRGGWVAGGAEATLPQWAKVRTLRAAEKLALGATLSSDAIEVTLRVLLGVTHSPAQRLSWNGATYAVQAVQTDSRNEYVVLTCFNSGK